MASKKKLKRRIAELEDRQRFLDARIERDRHRVNEVNSLRIRVAELEKALAAERAKAPVQPLAPLPPAAPWITEPPVGRPVPLDNDAQHRQPARELGNVC